MVGRVESEIFSAVRNGNSFVLDAGAGSGKTWTLIQTLNHIIETKGGGLVQNSQRIACITYTNVAKEEIIERTENNDLILVSTIHEFLWESVKQFQVELKQKLLELVEEKIEAEEEKLSSYGPRAVKSRQRSQEKVTKLNEDRQQLFEDVTVIRYENFPRYSRGILSHNELIVISEKMFSEYPKLRKIVTDCYPIILVDEYQDTQNETVTILLDYLLGADGFVVGFFGDKVQQIYDTGIGEIPDSYGLKQIKKEENHRSSTEVVNVLNKLRTDIHQKQSDRNDRSGSALFFHALDGNSVNINSFIEANLFSRWNIDNQSEVKVLYLTHRYIAKENGYERLLQHYSKGNKRDSLTDNLNNRGLCPFADFLFDLEELVDFFEHGRIQALLNKTSFSVNSLKDKKTLQELMDQLREDRLRSTIEEVIDFVLRNNLLRSSERMCDYELSDDDKREFHEVLMTIDYAEFSRLHDVQNDSTVFSTKHGTKGDEFDNVLVVIDDAAWNKYNFNDFFANDRSNEGRYRRTNNLFYVVCSRARNNLAVLIVSSLSSDAETQVKEWFQPENYFEC